MLGVLAAGLVALLVAALIIDPGQRKATTGAPPPATPPDPARLEQVVRDYYALLPDHPDQAWTRLGPELQAQGRQVYEAFWQQVSRLTVITPPRASGDGVTIEIEYTADGRGQVRETHRLDVLLRDGTPLINSDQVLASLSVSTSTDRDDDKKGRKKDNGRGRGNN